MIYGKLAPSGAIEEEVELCAVSERPVLGEHATMEQIGKSHFVRILASKTHLITPEMRAKWYADCGEIVATEEVVSEVPAQAQDESKSTGRRGKSAAPVETTEETQS